MARGEVESPSEVLIVEVVEFLLADLESTSTIAARTASMLGTSG
jgi:hypothetical protein